MDQLLEMRPQRMGAAAMLGRRGSQNRGPRRPSAGLVVAVSLALLVAAGLTYRATTAAFSASTSPPSSTFGAGTVTLTNSSSGSALFGVAGLAPGDSGQRCVTVNYTGNIDAAIRLYGSATGPLGSHLDLLVQESTTPAAADCTGFTPGTTVMSGIMSTTMATYGDYVNGAGTWPVTGAAARSYRVTYTLPSGASNAAQGTSVSLTLTWEAQST